NISFISSIVQLVGHSPTSASSSGVNTDSPSQHTHDNLRVQPEKKHICDICSKAFPYLSILESHKRCHTGEKPFKCHYCDKNFAQKATLQVHERTHTGERPYKCRYCEKTFAQYGTKTVHEKSAHLGIRNYKCPKCDKCLSSPSALYTHKKTHGEKVFRCQFCTKTFTLKNYLKLHVHEQTERKHICKFCHKSFAYAGSLQKSQLTAHEATHSTSTTTTSAPNLAPFDLNQSVAAALGAPSADSFLQGMMQQQKTSVMYRCSGCDKMCTGMSCLKAHQDSCPVFLNSSAASSSSSTNLRPSQSPINSASSDDDSSLHRQTGGEENVMLVEGRKLSLEPTPVMAVPNIYASISGVQRQQQLPRLQPPTTPTSAAGAQPQFNFGFGGAAQQQQPAWLQQLKQAELSPLSGAKASMGVVPSATLPEMASLTASMTSAFAPVPNSTDLLKGFLDQQQRVLTNLLVEQLQQQLQQRVSAAAPPPPPPPPVQQPSSLSLELLQMLQSMTQSAPAPASLPPSSLAPLGLQQLQPMVGRFPQQPLGLQLSHL
ncbi:hypothetical protein PMAYCL1PPCAC_15592, partial [Pristionchus mayeri]